VSNRPKPASRRAQSAHRLLAHLHRAGSVTVSRRKVSFDMRPVSSKHKKRTSDETEEHKRDASGYSSDSGIKRAGNKTNACASKGSMPLLAQLPAAAESWPVVSSSQWTTASTAAAASTAAEASVATARSRDAITGTSEAARPEHVAAGSPVATSSSAAAQAQPVAAPVHSHQPTAHQYAGPRPHAAMQHPSAMAATVPLWSVSAQPYAHTQAYHTPATQVNQIQHQAWFPGYANQWATTPAPSLAMPHMQAHAYFPRHYAMPENLHGHYYAALADAASPADHVARDVRGVLAGLVTGQAAPIGAGAVAGKLDGDDVVVSLRAASHLA
jgi:hypothetical protein